MTSDRWGRERLWERGTEYLRLMRFDRPIGILLLLWPTLWALWIAGAGHPRPGLVVIFVLGVIVMRAAGCIINDYADRDFDPHVRRTRERPLAAGRVTVREAMTLFAVLCAVAFLLVLLTNRLTILLSFVGLLLAASYPFMKRYTYLPQVYLGATFGWAIPMAFAAQTGAVPRVGWLLFIGNVLWASVYDTFYAMVDREDDLRIGVKSTAILFGDADRFLIGVLQSLLILDLVLVGRVAGLGAWYYAGVAGAAALASYHQYLIRNRDPQQCFRAFLHNHWLGMVVFAGIVVDYLSR
ncbi:MAG TPA: 4-hydroxybenzoate octaprenyltransferase [Chromatiales bacterium]|nr:4-hydroxybenzoate octaprenyltransferase [Chromatiales bacterium]